MAAPNTRDEATEQMFATVGRAITHWAFVEEKLGYIYTVCAGTVLPMDKDGIQVIDGWVPMWVFYSLTTFDAKRSIVDAAVTAWVYGIPQEQELLEEWGKLSQKGRSLARMRNKLAHWFVRPAQPRGSGNAADGFGPAYLMPPIGSPNYWRESGARPKRKSLTQVQVGHMETAFYLYSEKLRLFARKLTDTKELRDKDFQQALRLLARADQLPPTVQAQLRRVLASLE